MNNPAKQVRRRGRMGRKSAPITLAPVHDRKTTDIPVNAQIAAIEVDDPYSQAGQTEKIVVVRSIRADPLGNMHARSQIDDAQFHAGRQWQFLYERSSVGSVKSVSLKTPVDGGTFPDPITDANIAAMNKLRAVEVTLGRRDAKLIQDVLGHGMFIAQAAQIRGAESDSDIAGWGFIFRLALDVLAVEFGLATDKRRDSRLSQIH